MFYLLFAKKLQLDTNGLNIKSEEMFVIEIVSFHQKEKKTYLFIKYVSFSIYLHNYFMKIVHYNKDFWIPLILCYQKQSCLQKVNWSEECSWYNIF